MRLEQYKVVVMGDKNGVAFVEDRFVMAQNEYEALGKVMMEIKRGCPNVVVDLHSTSVEYSANNHMARLGRMNWGACNRTVKL